MSTVEEFVAKQRAKGLSDEDIVKKLVKNGWQQADAVIALTDEDIPPPPTHHLNKGLLSSSGNPQAPIAVVDQLSTKGFEYKLFAIALVLSLVAIIMSINNLLYDTSNGSFYLSMLVVSLPVMVVFYLRLRRAELKDPALKKDPSRRKISQAIMVVTFLAIIIHSIAILFLTISGEYSRPACPSYDSSYSYNQYQSSQPADNCTYNDRALGKDFASLAVTYLFAGSIFYKFWRDEQKLK